MIRVPTNWPMCWWGPGATIIRMACPGCGHFEMYADRSNGHPTLECKGCGLAGAANVQKAICAFEKAHQSALAQEQTDNEVLMAAEEERLSADTRTRGMRQNRMKGLPAK